MNELTELRLKLQKMVGLQIWKVLIGPAGMHLDFGDKLEDATGFRYGSFSVWIKCAFRITNEHCVFLKRSFPQEEDTGKVKSLVSGKYVERIDLDENANALRLLADSDLLISAFPGTLKSELCWILFDCTSDPNKNIIVYSDCFMSKEFNT